MFEYILELKTSVAGLQAQVTHLSAMMAAQVNTTATQTDKRDRISSVIERHRAIVGVFGVAAGAVGTFLAHLAAKVEFFK